MSNANASAGDDGVLAAAVSISVFYTTLVFPAGQIMYVIFFFRIMHLLRPDQKITRWYGGVTVNGSFLLLSGALHRYYFVRCGFQGWGGLQGWFRVLLVWE